MGNYTNSPEEYFHQHHTRVCTPERSIVKTSNEARDDWRKGGYRDGYQRVPPAPRKPSPFAKVLIHDYQGTQSALRTIGIVFLVIGIPLSIFICQGAMTDIALGLWGKPADATIMNTELLRHVEVNGRNPTEITYQYEIDGKRYEESSYTTNSDVVQTMGRGASVPIEILTSAPSWSRVRGTTSTQMGLGMLFFLLFPLVGAGMFGSAYLSNRREIRAFRDGTPTKGLIVKRGLNHSTEVNGKNPFEIVWEFQIDGTNYKGKLSNMHAELLNRAFPEEEVTVLYDPRDPKINTVWIE